jgi:hypothetical protein
MMDELRGRVDGYLAGLKRKSRFAYNMRVVVGEEER